MSVKQMTQKVKNCGKKTRKIAQKINDHAKKTKQLKINLKEELQNLLLQISSILNGKKIRITYGKKWVDNYNALHEIQICNDVVFNNILVQDIQLIENSNIEIEVKGLNEDGNTIYDRILIEHKIEIIEE